MKLLLILMALLFVGCDGDSSASYCESKGYKGIVLIPTTHSSPTYCSDGDLTPNKKSYITDDGAKLTELYEYYTKGIKWTTSYTMIQWI